MGMVTSRAKLRGITFNKEKLKGITISKEVILECIFAFIIIWMAVYRLSEMTMPTILNDEFGYWSNSMALTGRDWSSVTSRINYYSYGYSLILCVVRAVADFLGYGWADLYKVAVVFNIIFVVAGYLLSVKIAKRYMRHINRFIIPIVCFAAAMYPSTMIYTHYSLTECTLSFLFWLFAYIIMHVIDQPGVANHITLALMAIYMYTVHQRTLGLVIAATILVLALRLLKVNDLKHAVSYFVGLYVFFVIHSFMKAHIKNINYMGNPPKSIYEMLPDVFTKTMFIFLAAVVVVLIWLYLIEKGRIRLGLILFAAAMLAACGIGIKGLGITAGSDVDSRFLINDLAGQIGVLKNAFTKNGLIRLGMSVIGKWYYLAAATGLVICWGIKDLFLNAVFVAVDCCKRLFCVLQRKEYIVSEKIGDDYKRHLFLAGMFLSFASAFMINAIYKEGLYTTDDLFNGRYTEYLIGFVLIYSIDRLMADKNWLGTWFVCMSLFVAASIFCQNVLEWLQKTEFQRIHSLVFGLFFGDGDEPDGKMKEITRNVIPFALGFIILLKAGTSRLKSDKLSVIRLLAALMIPVMVWNYIYTDSVDKSVILHQGPSDAVPRITDWIKRLSDGEPVYFDMNGLYYRKAEFLQYMCEDISVTMSHIGRMDFSEDALFVLNVDDLDADIIKEHCEIVDTEWIYALAINKDQEVVKRWQLYKEALSR